MNTERNENQQEHPLVAYLIQLKDSQDRGALAALRSGLGKRPGEATRMLPYVARFLTTSAQDAPQVQAVFLTASLFASHLQHSPQGNLGSSLRKAVQSKLGEEGVSVRLAAALDADPEDLPRHLTGLVGMCGSSGAPINWTRFFWDVVCLLGGDEEKRYRTRLDWAREFWGRQQTEHKQIENKEKAS